MILEALEKPSQRAPEFIIQLRDKHVKAAEKLTLECKVVSEPTSQITWFKDNERINEEPKKIIIENDNGIQRLVIENVETSHQGIYRCVAENLMGISKTEAKLNLESNIFFFFWNFLSQICLKTKKLRKNTIVNSLRIYLNCSLFLKRYILLSLFFFWFN